MKFIFGEGYFDSLNKWIEDYRGIIWFIFCAGIINGYSMILFANEDFLQQYTGIIQYRIVSDFIVPAFKGWAISMTPIATSFFVGYLAEKKKQTENAQPLLVMSFLITLVATFLIIGILILPLILGWVPGVGGFEIFTLGLTFLFVLVIFPLSFIGTFLGAIWVSY